ncbi:MAG: class I SAM-dependent methyltransferase [Zoogloeaceae bacterium]|jgi:adenine-specific DNA-methyltransferase|nr:class I SAM-dependent methyltransferase [Zoogloeaceae bacterium]
MDANLSALDRHPATGTLFSAPKDVAKLGQVFTPQAVVAFMRGGCRNRGRVLEPSCGDGAFLRHFPGAMGIEMDRRHAPPDALNIDFFSYDEAEKFDTIIGNPPYVRFQDIPASTKALLKREGFDGRSNLYLFFIEKAVRHLKPGGELIFITPRDFLKATSAVKLNDWLHAHGTITHAVELGDAKIFQDAIPNCLIWRYELGNFSRKTHCAAVAMKGLLEEPLAQLPPHWNLKWEERNFLIRAGHLLFSRNDYPLRLSDVATVKVGAVSGADAIYADSVNGTMEFVCSTTAKSGQTRRMIWCPAAPHEALLPHKARLISRRIRRFDESNWWQWGRGCFLSDKPRVYVNSKTRNEKPFFIHGCLHYDGAVLAVFPASPHVDIVAFRDALNALDWKELGFVCDGRFLFSQRSLENAPVPADFSRFTSGRA